MGAEKKERKQSEREREWIERLVAKYGEDYQRMARDMRLNPMQQTAADLGASWEVEASGGSLSIEA